MSYPVAYRRGQNRSKVTINPRADGPIERALLQPVRHHSAIPGGSLSPHYFKPPVRHGAQPLWVPPQVYVQRPVGEGLLRPNVGVRALSVVSRALTIVNTVEVAISVINTIMNPGSYDPYNVGPQSGYYSRYAGPFWYGPPYDYAMAYSHAFIYHAPITGQAIPIDYGPPSWVGDIRQPDPSQQVSYWFLNWPLYVSFGVTRYGHHSSWIPVATPNLADNVKWVSAPMEAFVPPSYVPWLPSLAPHLFVPGQWLPKEAIPHHLLPHLANTPFRQSGYGDASPGPTGSPSYGSPYIPPSVVRWAEPPVVLLPNAVPLPTLPPPTPNRHGHTLGKPDPKREHEGKPRGKRVTQLLAVVGAVTEYLDTFNALYDALPDHIKKHPPPPYGTDWAEYHRRLNSPQYRSTQLLSHFSEIDWSKAVDNLIANHIEDKVIGTANKSVNTASRTWYDLSGRPVGWSTGPALGGEYGLTKAAEREYVKRERERQKERERLDQIWKDK